MTDILSSAAKAANREIQSREIAEVTGICQILASYQVEKEFQKKTPNVPVDTTSDEFIDAVDARRPELIMIARKSAVDFDRMMTEFIKDTDFEKIKEKADKDLIKQMGLVKAKAGSPGKFEFKVNAAESVSKSTHRIAANTVSPMLGVKYAETSGLRKIFGAFDPNTAKTSKEDRVDILDKKTFLNDQFYRKERLEEAKRYEEQGHLASEEQQKFAKYTLALAAEQERKRKIQSTDYMESAGARALFGIGKSLIGGTVKLGLASAKLGFGLGMDTLRQGRDYAKQVAAKTDETPVQTDTSVVESEVPSTKVDPYKNILPHGAIKKVSSTVAPTSAVSSGYVMPSYEHYDKSTSKLKEDKVDTPEETKADAEADEEREKTYEFQKTAVETLKSIDENVKKSNKDGGGGGLGSLLGIGGIAAAIAAAISTAFGKLGPLLEGLSALSPKLIEGAKALSSVLLSPGMMTFLKFAGAGVAIAAAERAIDSWASDKFGIGKDSQGKALIVDESKDDANWKKMSVLEKTQSGVARGVEYAGSLLAPNLVREAEFNRIENESKYLEIKAAAGNKAEIAKIEEKYKARAFSRTSEGYEAAITSTSSDLINKEGPTGGSIGSGLLKLSEEDKARLKKEGDEIRNRLQADKEKPTSPSSVIASSTGGTVVNNNVTTGIGSERTPSRPVPTYIMTSPVYHFLDLLSPSLIR